MEKIEKNGVTYYIENDTCVDLEVPASIQELAFYDFGGKIKKISLRNVQKSFPDITSLFIEYDINKIDISNYMFPNVRNVKSQSSEFLSRRTLIGFLPRIGYSLLNSFCLSANELIDIRSVEYINDYALEGCKTRVLSNNLEKIKAIGTHAFHDSAFLLQPGEHGVCMFSNWVSDIDYESDDTIIPANAQIPTNIIQLSKIKKLSFETCCTAMACDTLPKQVYILDAKASAGGLKLIASKTGLCHLNVIESNPECMTKDGVLFDKTGTTLLRCPSEKTGSYQIPETVRTVSALAFYRSQLESISFPDVNLQFHEGCFSYCKQLKDIQFGTGIKQIGPSKRVFFACKLLEEITIPPQIEKIGQYAFSFCSNLRHVHFATNAKLNDIEEKAFYRCPLEHVILPPSVEVLQACSLVGTQDISFFNNHTALSNCQLLHAVSVYVSNTDKLSVKDFDFCKIWKPEQDKPIIIPRKMNYSAELNRLIRSESVNLRQIYRFAHHQVVRIELAFISYQLYQEEEAKKYVRRYGKVLGPHLASIGENEMLKDLLDENMLSEAALEETRKAAEIAGNTVAQAYLLQCCKKTKNKKSMSL